MRRTRAVALLSALVMMLAVVSCTSPTTGGGGGAADSLTVGASLEPPSLDPVASDAAAVPQVVLFNVYETLVKVTDGGRFTPLLAEKYQVSGDRRTYTFTLRADARFSDGKPVTSADVKWSIDRVRRGNNGAAAAVQKVVASVDASNPRVVVVHLSRPSNSWLYGMSSTAGIVMNSAAASTMATATAGSGPYQLDRWVRGSELVLKRHDGYWGTKPTFATVTFRYLTDPNVLTSAMLSGGLDIISNLQNPQALPQFDDPARYKVIKGTTNGEVVMALNNTSKPLRDLRVRQAINYAIDRAALLKTTWAGQGTLIGSMVPPTDPWYQDLSGTYPYQPDRARSLLQEAGYGSGLKLRMRILSVPYARAAAPFIQSQLAQVGIQVDIEELDYARWLDEVFTRGNYDLSIVAHVEPRDIVRFADPHYYFHYNNPKVTQLVAEADQGPLDQQTVKLRQAAKILADGAAADWLFLLPNLVITTAQVTGVPKNATTLSFDLTTIHKTG